MSRKSTKSKSPIQVVRSIDEINKEYNSTCGKIGEAQFKMKSFEGQIMEWNKRLVQLHQEYAAASEKIGQKEATPAAETQATA